MTFSARFLDEMRRSVRLSELVSRYGVKLMRRQREFVGLCPFHRERTPSFSVVDKKHFFHCFGCGAHGDVFGFVMRIDNLEFGAAVAKIAGGAARKCRAPQCRRISRLTAPKRRCATGALRGGCGLLAAIRAAPWS